jgi:hypothetical protein
MLLSWILRTSPSVSLIVNLRSPATDTFADGLARVNSSVKAGGVSISAQMATQIATIENSTPKQSRMPRPYPRLISAISGAMKKCSIATAMRIGT